MKKKVNMVTHKSPVKSNINYWRMRHNLVLGENPSDHI